MAWNALIKCRVSMKCFTTFRKIITRTEKLFGKWSYMSY